MAGSGILAKGTAPEEVLRPRGWEQGLWPLVSSPADLLPPSVPDPTDLAAADTLPVNIPRTLESVPLVALMSAAFPAASAGSEGGRLSDNLTGNTDFPRAPSTLGTCGPACWGPAVRGQGQVTTGDPEAQHLVQMPTA